MCTFVPLLVTLVFLEFRILSDFYLLDMIVIVHLLPFMSEGMHSLDDDIYIPLNNLCNRFLFMTTVLFTAHCISLSVFSIGSHVVNQTN